MIIAGRSEADDYFPSVAAAAERQEKRRGFAQKRWSGTVSNRRFRLCYGESRTRRWKRDAPYLSLSRHGWFWRFLVHPTNENPHRETIKIYLLHGFLRRNANAFRTHKTEKKKTRKTPCKLIRPHNHPLPAKMQKRHGHTKK